MRGTRLTLVVNALSGVGYQGWYVLEQDLALDAEPEPARGPLEAVGRSLEFVLSGMSSARR